MQNKNLVQKNIEDFNNILDIFFSKKELTLYNYLPEFAVLNKNLKNNFKELNSILASQENLEEICIYLYRWKLEILKEENTQGFSDLLTYKKIHCYNLLEYLEVKQTKGINQKFEIIYRNFFENFYDDMCEYFRRKKKENAV